MIRSPRRTARFVAVAVAASLAVLTAGCSYLGGGDTGGDSGVLKILVHSNAPTDAEFKKINARFEKEHPGVKVQFSTAIGTDFDTVKNTRLTAKDVDITEGSSQGGTSLLPKWVVGQKESSWVQGLAAGAWVDLTDEPFMKNFSAGVLDQFAYKGKQYAVPTGVSHETGVFYNKAMFEQYGLSVPTTWDEMLHTIDMLKQHGVSPFIMGGKDLWPAVLPTFGMVQSLYPDTVQLDKDLWTGKADLAGETSLTLMKRVQTVYDNTLPNWTGIDYASVPSRFVKGEAAMLPDGSWEIPAITTADPKFQFGYFPMPGSDTASDNKYLASKLEFSLAIPKSSKNQKLAKEWLALYASKDVYTDFIAGSGFGPAQSDLKLPADLTALNQYLPKSGFVPAWDQVFHTNVSAGPIVATPFAYDSIAPLGTESDMVSLTKQMQAAWQGGLPK